jgi:hypothetical protein
MTSTYRALGDQVQKLIDLQFKKCLTIQDVGGLERLIIQVYLNNKVPLEGQVSLTARVEVAIARIIK